MSYIEYVTMDHEAEDPMPDLRRTNGFSEADLARNRSGAISDQQMGKLFGRAFKPVGYPLSALAAWLFACFVVKMVVPDIILVIVAMLGGKMTTVIFGAVTLGCLAAAFVGFLRSSRLTVLLMQDLSRGKSAYMDGRLHVSKAEDEGLGLDKFHGRNRRLRHYVMNNEYFEVDEEAAEVAERYGLTGRYRIYYAPKSKLLLSLEPAPAAK